MNVSNTISFSFRLITSRWGRNLLVFFGLFLGSFLLALYFSFSEGIRKNIIVPLEKELKSEVIIVMERPKTTNGSFNPYEFFRGQSESGMPQKTIDEILAMPEVAEVEGEIRVPFPVATSAEIVTGVGFLLDSTISGYSENAVREYLPEGMTFQGDEEVLPILLSPILVEIYNSTIVEIVPTAQRKTLEDFIDREIELTFGKINYLNLPPFNRFPEGVDPVVRKGKVVGFAPFLTPFTLGIPEKTAREMRVKFEEIRPEDIQPRSLIIKARAPELANVLKQRFEGMGLWAKDLSKNLDSIRLLFVGTETLLLVSAGLVLFVALLFLISTLSISVLEHRHDIGILRSLGASKGTVQNIFLFQGMLIAITSSLSGFFLALLLASSINQLFLSLIPVFAISLKSIFLFDFYFFSKVFLGVACSALLASLIPARKAARMKPIEAILV